MPTGICHHSPYLLPLPVPSFKWGHATLSSGLDLMHWVLSALFIFTNLLRFPVWASELQKCWFLMSSKSTQMQSLTIFSHICLSVLGEDGGDAKSYHTGSSAQITSILLPCAHPGARRTRQHKEGQFPPCDERHPEQIELMVSSYWPEDCTPTVS